MQKNRIFTTYTEVDTNNAVGITPIDVHRWLIFLQNAVLLARRIAYQIQDFIPIFGY